MSCKNIVDVGIQREMSTLRFSLQPTPELRGDAKADVDEFAGIGRISFHDA